MRPTPRHTTISHTQDYSSYGMVKPEREYQSDTGYRYGFNGQEKDNEVAGDNSSYTAEYWQYDPRLGRRWNVDKVIKSYQSQYLAFSNNPIAKVDPNGNADYYTADGTYIGNSGKSGEGDGRIIIVTDKNKITEIDNVNKAGQGYDLSGLTSDQFFELPPYDARQMMYERIQKLPTPCFYEISGIIEMTEVYEDDPFNTTKECTWKNYQSPEYACGGNPKSYYDRDHLAPEEQIGTTPMQKGMSNGKKRSGFEIQWRWHTHPNGIYDKNCNRKLYRENKKINPNDNNVVHKYESSGDEELALVPSTSDINNLGAKQTGIMYDQKTSTVHLYSNDSIKNETHNAKLNKDFFFIVKEGVR